MRAAYGWCKTILAKDDAVSEAPPTSAPSISGQRIISSTCACEVYKFIFYLGIRVWCDKIEALSMYLCMYAKKRTVSGVTLPPY
jgi:hypothetical protein